MSTRRRTNHRRVRQSVERSPVAFAAQVKSIDESPPTLDRVRERPGGRSERVRCAVLAAARNELLETGWEGFSHRSVARRAGVDPATVYRRWPTRPRLAVDALLEMASEVPLPDTGSVAGDLDAFLRRLHGVLEDPSLLRLLHALSIATGSDDDELRETVSAFWGSRFEQAAVMVERAVARGELPRDVDAHELIERLVSPFYFRALISAEPLDDALIGSSVEAVLSEARR